MRRLGVIPGPYTYALAIEDGRVLAAFRHEVGAIIDGKRVADAGDRAALVEQLQATQPDDVVISTSTGAIARPIADALTKAFPAARVVGEWRSRATGDEWTSLEWPAGDVLPGHQDAAALLLLSPWEPQPTRDAFEVRAGIDPGSAAVGLVIAAGTAAPLRLLHAASIPVGDVVELATPRVVAGGQVRTHRRTLTGDHVAAVARAVKEACLRYGVTRAIVEHAETVYLPDGKPRAHVSIATAMNKTTWVGGDIAAVLRENGISVERVPRPTWRARVLPKRKGSAGDGNEALPGVIADAFPGWVGDEHARDAAGVLLWDVLGPREKVPTRSRTGTACTCPKTRGRHLLGCPLATAEKGPRKVWTWESAKGALGL